MEMWRTDDSATGRAEGRLFALPGQLFQQLDLNLLNLEKTLVLAAVRR